MKTTDTKPNVKSSAVATSSIDHTLRDERSSSLSPSDRGEDRLGWEELHSLFPELSSEPCERFSLLLDLYLDERLAPHVLQELRQHQEGCETCTQLKERSIIFRQNLIVSFDAIESDMTVDDAEESLQHVLEHRWDELELGNLGLDALRDEALRASIFSQHFVAGFEELEPVVTTDEAEESLHHLLEHRWDELELSQLGLDELRNEVLQASVFHEQFVVGFEQLESTITTDEAEESLHHLLEHRWEELDLCDLNLDELREETLSASILSTQFIQCFDEMTTTATQEDAEASLHHLLEQRWDELNLADLGLEELRDDVVGVSSSKPNFMRVEYHPPTRTARPKKRILSALFTAVAAAILFAYGPNLIETNVGERETGFPSAIQEDVRQSSVTQAPLSSREGQILTASTQSPQMILSRIEVGQVSDQVSTHLTYHLNLKSADDRHNLEVDLWQKRVNSQQQIGFTSQLRRGDGPGEIHVLSEADLSVRVRRYQLPDSDLNIAEYLVGDQHYQWSSQLKSTESEALLTLVKAHLKELAH